MNAKSQNTVFYIWAVIIPAIYALNHIPEFFPVRNVSLNGIFHFPLNELICVSGFAAFCLGTGLVFFRKMPAGGLKLIFSFTAGCIFSVLIFAVMSLFGPVKVPLWLFTASLAGGYFVMRQIPCISGIWLHSIQDIIISFLIIIIAGMALVEALAPVSCYDSQVYHLNVAQALSDSGMNEARKLTGSTKPVFGHLIFAAVLSASSETGCKLIHWMFYIFGIVAVGVLCGVLVQNSSAGILCAGLYAAVPAGTIIAGWGYVDHIMIFFALALFCAVCNVLRSSGNKALFAGLCAGACINVKFSGLYAVFTASALFFAAMIIDISNPNRIMIILKKNIMKSFGLFLLMVVICMIPWYSLNYMQYGNPVYPYFSGGESDNTPDDFIDLFGMGHEPLQIFFLLPNLSLRSQIHTPEFSIYYFDGMLAPVFLSFFPLIFWGKRTEKRAAVFFCTIVLFALFAVHSHQARHALLLYSGLSVLSALLASEQKQRNFSRGAQYVCMFLLIFSAIYLSARLFRQKQYFSAFGIENRQEYLSSRLYFYDAYDWCNKYLPDTVKIMVPYEERFFYLKRPHFFLSLMATREYFKKKAEKNNTDTLAESLFENGITHIFISDRAFALLCMINPEYEEAIHHMHEVRKFKYGILYSREEHADSSS